MPSALSRFGKRIARSRVGRRISSRFKPSASERSKLKIRFESYLAAPGRRARPFQSSSLNTLIHKRQRVYSNVSGKAIRYAMDSFGITNPEMRETVKKAFRSVERHVARTSTFN